MAIADITHFGSHLKKIHTHEKTDQDSSQNDPFTTSSRRQSQILDRWVARQAKEMITTIERQAHQAELSALSVITQPVSAKAATFLGEKDQKIPSLSENSGGNGGGSAIRPNVRASSLIQMWREMEAEVGTPKAAEERKVARENLVCGSDKGGNLVRVRCRREMEDLVERMMKDRGREVCALAELGRVSRFSHRGRIQSVLKLRFLRKDFVTQNQAQPASTKKASERSQSGVTILFLRERFDNRSENNSKVPVTDTSSTHNAQFPIASQDSCSSHSPDQLSIDNNQHQEVISIEDREILLSESTSPQSISEDLHNESQSAELNSMHSCSEELNEGSRAHEFNLIDSTSNGRNERSPTPEVNSLNPRNEDLCDGFQSPDASWDERNLWESNLGWQRPMESPNANCWPNAREIVSEEIEPYSPQDIINARHIWMGSSSLSCRGWGINSPEYHDYFETFSDNVEIRELLERRRVTTSLASDFCDKMNQTIMKIIQRQEEQYAYENFYEEYGEQPTVKHNYEFNNANEVASDSALVPSSCQTLRYPDNWQYTSFTNQSSRNLQELESVQDLKIEMAEIHQEVSELRKLLKSCMEWQSNIQDSIKKEVSSAICQSVLDAKLSENSKCSRVLKDGCCICHERQVDSLLYRCGHTCTCFKCAHELQWKNGRCPICQASIIDVVRVHPNT